MIHFVKILRYNLYPNVENLFEYLCDVTSQKIDPPTLEPNTLELNAQIVLHSSLSRAVSCIKRSGTTAYLRYVELNEIPFDLSSFCSKEEWDLRKSEVVREQFSHSFVKDTLLTKREVILKQVLFMISVLREATKKQKTVAIVSHSFKMKLFEAMIKSQGKLKDNPELIYDYIKPSQKTFDFGAGFSVDPRELEFLLQKK